MTVIIAGAPAPASTLADEPKTPARAAVWSGDVAAPEGSVAGLAQALLAFEAEATAQQLESVVLADDSDAALAAALVGTKLPVEVLAVAGAREAASVNGRLIGRLAAAYTPPA